MRRRGGSNEVLYVVESDSTLTKTSIYHPDSDTPIAFIETKELLGWDKITLKGEERRNIKDWISGYGVFQTLWVLMDYDKHNTFLTLFWLSPMWFTHNGRRYHWRTNFLSQLGVGSSWLSLSEDIYWLDGFSKLFNDHDAVRPIAWYERSKVRVVEGILTGFRACLALEEEAIEIRDSLVISFLAIEGQMRKDIRPSGIEGRVKRWLWFVIWLSLTLSVQI